MLDLSRYRLDLERRHFGIAAAALFAIWFYFSWITGPNGVRIQELREAIETTGQQMEQLRVIREKQAHIDKLLDPGEAAQTIETRVERVARELKMQRPQITKEADSTGTSPNRVRVQMNSLYLRELIEFLKKIEEFPVTIQVVRLEIEKQANVAGITLVLSDLNL